MGNKVEYYGQMLTLKQIGDRTRLKEADLQAAMKLTDDIYKAVFIARYGKQKLDELEEYYRGLGLENFLSGEGRRTLLNLQAARIIVEVFFNGQNIEEVGEEIYGRLKKNALDYLLKHPFLNMNSKFSGSLTQIVSKIYKEKIPKEMAVKIYKIIIYLSAKSSYTVEKTKITYSALLSQITFQDTLDQIKKIINDGKDMPTSEVLDMLDVEGNKKKDKNKKKQNSISDSDRSSIISYFEEIGLLDFINVDGKLIYSYENLEQANQMVEKYFGETISKREKKSVLMCILGNPLLRNNNLRKTCVLSALVDRLKMTGLGERDIFAIIINCGIEGKILEYSYGEVLCIDKSFISRVKENQDIKGITEVYPSTLEMAVSKSRDKEEEIGVCEYYNRLGLGNIIYSTSGKLYYSESDLNKARQITEGYFGDEKISEEVKKAVLMSLLRHDLLRSKAGVEFDKLATVINRMREKGLEDRDIYGLLINLSFTKFKADYGCTYNQLLQDPKKVDDILQGEYKTVVTFETLAAMINGDRRKKVKSIDMALLGPLTSREIRDKMRREMGIEVNDRNCLEGTIGE